LGLPLKVAKKPRKSRKCGKTPPAEAAICKLFKSIASLADNNGTVFWPDASTAKKSCVAIRRGN
jgi:hypothetical protein